MERGSVETSASSSTVVAAGSSQNPTQEVVAVELTLSTATD